MTVAGVGSALVFAPLAVLPGARAFPPLSVVAPAAAAAVLVLPLQVVPIALPLAPSVPRSRARVAPGPPPFDGVATGLAASVLGFEVGQERRPVALMLPR